MTIIERLQFSPCDDPSEPDDFRPRSSWAAAVDPAHPDGKYVRDLVLLVDVVAPGDRVPLHKHPIDELAIVEEGTAEVTLGDETRTVSSGTALFIPAGTAHSARNVGSKPWKVLGVFPAERVGFEYLERNPAPGTEGDPPRPAYEVDVRAEADARLS
jgi:mannose-6-phosphate isomerase-like protein (cupin superfamily)